MFRFPPALAVASEIRRQGLKPYLLVHPNCLPDLPDQAQDPDCVVLGDAVDGFSYQNMNKAFRILMSSDDIKLFSLGKGKYYKEDDDLTMDVGPFTTALEFATGRQAVICGKPSADFFRFNDSPRSWRS